MGIVRPETSQKKRIVLDTVFFKTLLVAEIFFLYLFNFKCV